MDDRLKETKPKVAREWWIQFVDNAQLETFVHNEQPEESAQAVHVKEVLSEVSLDAGKDEAALKWADEYYPDSKMWDSKDGNAYQGFLAGWSAKPTRPLTELTAGELMEHNLVKDLVEAAERVNEFLAERKVFDKTNGRAMHMQEFVQVTEALAPFRGEDDR